jgi:hypothetical protein
MKLSFLRTVFYAVHPRYLNVDIRITIDVLKGGNYFGVTIEHLGVGVVCFRFMVFNATFNNISAISWRSVLLVEET